MGGAASSLVSGIPNSPTGNEFSQHVRTSELKKMSNALFQFMYAKWNIREVFDITERPGEYVIAISDLINTEFHVLGYTTKKNKIGEIYFRKWSDLDPPQSRENLEKMRTSSNNITRSARLKRKEELIKKEGRSPDRGERGSITHAQHAKIIAYYYVRLFQILGSLLLVIKDTEFPFLDERTGDPISTEYSIRDREYAQQQESLPSYIKQPVALPLFKPPAIQQATRLAQGVSQAQARGIAEQPPYPAAAAVGGGSVRQSGGSETYYDLNDPLGGFEFLRFYLRKYDQETVERYAKDLKLQLPPPNSEYYKFAGNDSLLFRFKKPDNLPNTISAGETAELIVFAKTERGTTYEKKSIQVKVSQLVPEHPSEYKAPSQYRKEERLNKFPYQVILETREKRQGSSTPLISATFQKNDETDLQRDYERGVKYKIVPGDKSSLYDTIISNSERILPTELQKILEKLVLITLNKTSSEVFYKFTIKSLDDKEKYEREGYDKSKAEAPKNNRALAEIFNTLNRVEATETKGAYKHIPHCIKRAQDLLDNKSISNIDGLKKAETRICSSDINGPGNKYVPLKSITQLYGKLKVSEIVNVDANEFQQALNVLKAFVGKESVGFMTVSELQTAKQESEASELSQALQRLSKAFGQLQNMKDKDVKAERLQLDKLEDIKFSRPSRCASDKGVGLIDKSRPVFKTMQAYAQALLGFHLNNTINISKFLMSVFNISQRADGSWNVEGPKTEILFAGFSVLDQLTDQARELLLAYYIGCEDIYQKGVKAWDEDKEDPTYTSRPVANPQAAQASAGRVPANSDYRDDSR